MKNSVDPIARWCVQQCTVEQYQLGRCNPKNSLKHATSLSSNSLKPAVRPSVRPSARFNFWA